MTNKKKKSAEEVTQTRENRLFELLMEGIEKGITPWDNGLIRKSIRREVVGIGSNGKDYNGWNAIMSSFYIMIRGFKHRMFLTSPAIKSRGGIILKGEKALIIRKPVPVWYDEDGEFVPSSKIKQMSVEELAKLKKKLFFELCNVWNVDQTTLNVKEDKELIRDNEDDENTSYSFKERESVDSLCTDYMSHCGITFYDNDDLSRSPFYKPSDDSIHIMSKSMWKSSIYYYGALLHEMVHSTGTKERLNRDMTGMFGTRKYAQEELVAEFGSSILLSYFDFKEEEFVENNSAYLKSWAKVFKENKDSLSTLLGSAFSNAKKATEYILEGTK